MTIILFPPGGVSTGNPPWAALRLNGSPDVRFETDENNTYFLAHLDIHPAFLYGHVGEQDNNHEQNTISGQNDSNVHTNVHINVHINISKEIVGKLSERQISILNIIYENPTYSLDKMSTKLKVSKKTIQREFFAIKKLGARIVFEGGRKNGHWTIRTDREKWLSQTTNKKHLTVS